MNVVKTAISLDPALLRRIDAVAEELDAPRSQVIRQATEEFLRKYESRKLLARLNRAYAGEPSQEEVELEHRMRTRHRQRVQGEW